MNEWSIQVHGLRHQPCKFRDHRQPGYRQERTGSRSSHDVSEHESHFGRGERVCRVNPAICSSVVFPEPDGPTTTKNSPSWMAKTNNGHESYREISGSHCVIPTSRSCMPPLGKPLPLKACVVSLPEYAANNAFLLRKRHSAGQHPRPAGA
jgi:hypothetical protein